MKPQMLRTRRRTRLRLTRLIVNTESLIVPRMMAGDSFYWTDYVCISSWIKTSNDMYG